MKARSVTLGAVFAGLGLCAILSTIGYARLIVEARDATMERISGDGHEFKYRLRMIGTDSVWVIRHGAVPVSELDP